MKTNIINAKKMLMSTLAAVAFSFVFSTSGNASTIGTIGDAPQYEASKCDVQKSSNDMGREKTRPETVWELVLKYIWPR
jgi:hypothetical protein